MSARLRANDRQRFLALLSLTEDIRLVYDWLEEGLYWKRRWANLITTLSEVLKVAASKHFGPAKGGCTIPYS